MDSHVFSFAGLPASQLAQAGGKGATLARLLQSGYPVPDGLVILPRAFEAGQLAQAAWQQVQAGLARLRSGDEGAPFAVRSSALAEDSAQASYAGEFESLLNVRGDDGIRRAIESVHQSQHAERVAAYSQALHLEGAGHGLAVVVQRMARAEMAGVLFTADPVSGSHAAMVGQFVHGLGDQLVSGEADGAPFELRRPRGRYQGPAELRPVARQLFQLASRLERELGGPQDIEWAVVGRGRQRTVALLQARPVTTLRGGEWPAGYWNDSRLGDYLWSNTNYGEAVPDVMTPATWSLLNIFMNELLPLKVPGHHPLLGNLGGRFYVNITLFASMLAAFGYNRRRLALEAEELFGRLPDDQEIPIIPFSLTDILRVFVPFAVRAKRRLAASQKALPGFLATAEQRIGALKAQVAAASDGAALVRLWRAELLPFFLTASRMLQAGTSPYENAYRPLRRQLEKQVGQADANALLSGLSAGGKALASLGPVLGLWQMHQGQLSREEYSRQYGHRGPHEFEIASPSPAEDPGWIDSQLDSLRQAPVDVPGLLARQQDQRQAAWQRYVERYPRQAPKLERRLAAAAAAARNREAIRSELTRAFSLVRAFAVRAGQLAAQVDLGELGDDVFFLSLDEMLAVLEGDRAALAHVPARRASHARLGQLPPYPTLIRGRFDPERWAADPLRRTDRYDASAVPAAQSEGALRGYAGAAGVVEGVVRVLRSMDEAHLFQPGEILVTTTTNVGWTPIFPRAAAVVTDVGAPLSHAAIVARELGIPAVVGCGDATTRLRNGDRVRVDGGLGAVHIM